MDWDDNIRRRMHHPNIDRPVLKGRGFSLPAGMPKDQSVKWAAPGYGWYPEAGWTAQKLYRMGDEIPGEGMVGGAPLSPSQFGGDDDG